MRSYTSATSSTVTGSQLNQLENNAMTTNLLNSYQTTSAFSNSNMNQTNTNDWESLRKQARQLENEIDSKLVGFSKLCSNFAASSYSTPSSPNSNANTMRTSTSANSSSSDLLFMTLTNEIEEALKKLTILNGKMSDCLNNENSINSSATVHTLQRHRDILRDYSHEFDKTKRNILSYKEREKLLTSSSSSRTSNENTNLNNRRLDNSNNGSTSFYMKEYDHLKSSHSLIDQQLEIAELTKENLQSQRQTLRMIQQKMNTIAHKFPLINNLVKRVKLKKRKDSIILADRKSVV